MGRGGTPCVYRNSEGCKMTSLPFCAEFILFAFYSMDPIISLTINYSNGWVFPSYLKGHMQSKLVLL